mgnify:CR=1 FL=1
METQKTNLEELRKQFQDYKNQKKNQNTRKSKDEILAKYFTPRADQEYFRVLPPEKGKKHIQEAFFHVVPVTIAGGKKRMTKIYCPAHNEPFVPKKDGEGNVITDQEGKPVMTPQPCPLCEKSKAILRTQDPSVKGKKKDELISDRDKEIWEENRKKFMEANKWQAKKFYIVRGIDKGKPKDGVKFWRFKHNFKNQGVFDKLVPVLSSYIEQYQADFADPEKGTDLAITVTDGQFNNVTYKQVSAIIPRGPSKLSEDPLVARQWLNDPITWRDVFKPRKAPNITPYQYLEMLANGEEPYWDDSDPQDKKWRFPGNSDLEKKANERNDSLDAEDTENFEQASDISNDGVNIGNVTEKHVGEFTDKGTDIGNEVKENFQSKSEELTQSSPETQTTSEKEPVQNTSSEEESPTEGFDDIEGGGDDYDDLPF